MARTRAQNNITKPIKKYSASSPPKVRKKTTAEPPTSTAQGSSSDTRNKRKGRPKKTEGAIPSQPQEEPEDEQDEAGEGSAIRDEGKASESAPKKAKPTKPRGKRQKVDVKIDKNAAEAGTRKGVAEPSSSAAVEHAADEEENEPASSGSKSKGKVKVSSKASGKRAKPRNGATKSSKSSKSTRAEAERYEAYEGDDGDESAASQSKFNQNPASKGSGKTTKPRNRTAKSSRSTTAEKDDDEAVHKDDELEPSTAQAKAKPGSASKGAVKSTRTRKKADKKGLATEDATEGADGESEPPAPTATGELKAAPNATAKMTRAKTQATMSKDHRSRESADNDSTQAPSASKSKGATSRGRRKMKTPPVDDTQHDTAGPSRKSQDESLDDSNSRPTRFKETVTAPKSAAPKIADKVMKNPRAHVRINTTGDINDAVEAKPKRGPGRPPKKSEKPGADPQSGEGNSATAKRRGKGRGKPADTTYRHSAEDEGDDDPLSGDAEDHEEGPGSPKKRRRVQDPTYRPDADEWSEPSPLSEHKAGVNPVRDRNAEDEKRNAPVWDNSVGLQNAGYANNLLPPSERAVPRSPDFDERGKLGWRPSIRSKRQGPGARRRKMTKGSQANTAQAETGDNDDPTNDNIEPQTSAPDYDRQEDTDGSHVSGSEESEFDYRSDLRSQADARPQAGPSSKMNPTLKPSKGSEAVAPNDRPAQVQPPRRPGDRDLRSQAGPTPQLSGIRGVSGLSIPSVQPNTLKRPRKTVGELNKEERQRKRDAKRRRRTGIPDPGAEEGASQQHPSVSFEDPAPGSQEDEGPPKRGHKRRHSSTVFATVTNTRRVRSWPIENPSSRRDPAETDNPPSPGSARKKQHSESETSMVRAVARRIPDDAWSEALGSSSKGSGTAYRGSDAASASSTSSRTLSAATRGPRPVSFMSTTVKSAFNMFYRAWGVPWGWGTQSWREARAAEKRSEREKARKAARREKGRGRVPKGTRSKKPAAAAAAAAEKGKGKQKETAPEAEVQDDLGREEEEEEEQEKVVVAEQDVEERTGGSMNTRKGSSGNVLTITQTTTVKTPGRPSGASKSASPPANHAASILGNLARGSGEGRTVRQTTPLQRHGGPEAQEPSPRTKLAAQLLEDLRHSGGESEPRNEGGGELDGEGPMLASEDDIRGEEEESREEDPDEAGEERQETPNETAGDRPHEEEVAGLTEDQETTGDEDREVQTPMEGDDVPLRGGMFRMAQRRIGKSSD